MRTAVISPLGVYSYLFPSFITSMLLFLLTPVNIYLLSCLNKKVTEFRYSVQISGPSGCAYIQNILIAKVFLARLQGFF